jgi:YggT family protein
MLTSGIAYLLLVLSTAVNIYLFVLFVRVLLTWLPNIDFSNPVLGGVASITDPYLNMFRGVIPPIGGIDLSAILAFIALRVLQGLLEASSAQFQSMSLGF